MATQGSTFSREMEIEVREMSKNSSSSLNTTEALILGNPPPPPSPSPPLDDDDHHLFNSSLSSSLSSTDRFDPIKNYPSISSLEIDSKNHSHQPMEEEEEQQQRGTREEERMKVKKSSCSIVKGRSAIKEKRRRSSVMKRKKEEMMCPSEESTSVVPKDKERKSSFGTPQSKRLDNRDREWDHDRDFEFMLPPGSHKKSVPAPVDVDQPIDPNEPTYCVCHQVSFGDMIACDMDNCQGGEWFHYSCVGLTPETRFKGNWYCPTCKLLPFIVSKAIALEPEQLESK